MSMSRNIKANSRKAIGGAVGRPVYVSVSDARKKDLIQSELYEASNVSNSYAVAQKSELRMRESAANPNLSLPFQNESKISPK